MISSKKELRRHYKSLRLNMDDKEKKDSRITENLLNSYLYKNAQTVFVYASSAIEVDTLSIIKDAFLQNKTVATPRCNPEDCTMRFYMISSFDDLSAGAYGIFEPKESCKEALLDSETLCIVPGLSFDKDGYRLGFGKGYYDRFLASFPGKTVGLCYEECVCEKTVRDKFDKSVSALITDTEIYIIK